MKFLDTNWRMVFLFLFIGIIHFFFGEKTPVANGLGYDGQIYGAWAKNFFNEFFVKGYANDAYYIQRVLPSVVIHYSLRFLHLSLQDAYIVKAFEVLNLILLVTSCWVWGLIAKELKLSENGKWLGFFALFTNVAILKINFYNPVLTDTAGFALGIFLLYFYLTNNSPALLMTTILGAFCWPTILLEGLVLFVFPRGMKIKSSDEGYRWGLLIPIGMSLGVILGIIEAYFIKNFQPYGHPALSHVLTLSIVGVISYLFFSYYYLFRNLSVFDLRLLKMISLRRLTVAILLWLFLQGAFQWLTIREVHRNWGYFFELSMVLGIRAPLVFIISHIIYFGPILLLTLFLWRRFCNTISQYGIGIILVVALTLFWGLNSESRKWVSLFPFFAVFTVKLIDSLNWDRWRYYLLWVSSLFYSKFWFAINSKTEILPEDTGIFLQFPSQYYHMNHGAFMSNETYFIQGAVVLATAMLFYFKLVDKN